jgi:hypothetical protein
MTVARLADQVAIAGRIGLVTKLIGAGETLHSHVVDVTSGALLDPVVFTDADVRTAGIASALDPDDLWLPRRMATLASGISGAKALARAVVARRGELRIERAVGAGGPTAPGLDGVSASLAITGPASLDDELAVASAIGLSDGAVAALGDRLRALAGDPARRDRIVRVTVFSGPAGHDMTIELGAPVDDVLAVLAVADATPAQIRLLERVHPILAAGRPAWLRCGVTADALDPGATLVYGPTSLDTARHVVSGLATTEFAEGRFAALVSAAGADAASWLELAIGPVDPIRLRIGVPV